MSKEIFSTRLNLFVQDNEAAIFYGPFFFIILALPLKIFGLTVFSAALTPMFLGIICLISAYIIALRLTQSNILALLFTFVLSSDPFFLEATRTIRPDILALLISMVTCYFYLKSNYIFTFLFILFGLFTHPYLGFIPVLSVLIHFIISKKKPYIFPFLIVSASLFRILSLNYFRAQELIDPRIVPSLAPIINIVFANSVTKAIFFTHFLIFILLILSKKSSRNSFWFVFSLITSVFVLWGSSTWYIALFILPSYFCLISVDKKIPRIFLAVTIFTLNIGYQNILISTYSQRPKYEEYSQKISEKLTPNAKIFLNKPVPDPYFYLAEKRPDLTIFSPPYSNHPGNYEQAIKQADYAVIKYEDFDSSPFLKSLHNYLKDKKYEYQVIPYQPSTQTGSVIIKLKL